MATRKVAGRLHVAPDKLVATGAARLLAAAACPSRSTRSKLQRLDGSASGRHPEGHRSPEGVQSWTATVSIGTPHCFQARPGDRATLLGTVLRLRRSRRCVWTASCHVRSGSPATKHPKDSATTRAARAGLRSTGRPAVVLSSEHGLPISEEIMLLCIEQHDLHTARLTCQATSDRFPCRRTPNRPPHCDLPPTKQARLGPAPTLANGCAAGDHSVDVSLAHPGPLALLPAEPGCCSSPGNACAHPKLTVAYAFNHMATRLDFNSY